MRPRAFNAETDLIPLNKLLNGTIGDINTALDALVVVEDGDHLCGAVGLRPIVYVHELAVERGMLSRRIADEALCYSLGVARAQGHQEAFFVVSEDNVRMRKWLEERGAKRQPDGIVYCMEVK